MTNISISKQVRDTLSRESILKKSVLNTKTEDLPALYDSLLATYVVYTPFYFNPRWTFIPYGDLILDIKHLTC